MRVTKASILNFPSTEAWEADVKRGKEAKRWRQKGFWERSELCLLMWPMTKCSRHVTDLSFIGNHRNVHLTVKVSRKTKKVEKTLLRGRNICFYAKHTLPWCENLVKTVIVFKIKNSWSKSEFLNMHRWVVLHWVIKQVKRNRKDSTIIKRAEYFGPIPKTVFD